MTSPGQYGSHQYQSPETRALASITAESYDKDQAKTLIKLKNDVGYMAAYMRKMQKSIDQANENFIQQIQSFIADFIALLGGASLTSIDFGDLRYVIQAIGALLGFQTESGIPIPINLFTAAWNFFGVYIAPLEQFTDLIYELIDAAFSILIDALGDIPVVGQAIQQLVVWLSELRDTIGPIVDTLGLLFDTLGGQPGSEIGDLIPGIFRQLMAIPEILEQVTEAIVNTIVSVPALILSLLYSLVDLIVTLPDTLTTLLTGLLDQLVNSAEMLEQLLNGLIELLISIPNYLGTLLFSLIDLLMQTPDLLVTLLNGLISLLISLPQISMDLLAAFIGILISAPDLLLNLLTGLMDLLFSLPSMLGDLAAQLVGLGGLLGGDSPLNALNLFNIIPTNVLGQISVSTIGDFVTNLISDPNFLDVNGFSGGGDWFHSVTAGFGGLGAVWTFANGFTHELLGNLIPVSQGQTMPITGMAKWTGLAGSGTPVQLAVTGYKNNSATTQATVASHNVSPPTTDWLTLAGEYTVPANVDSIRTRLVVTAGASAGQVWFSNLSAGKTGRLVTDLIDGILPNNTLTDELVKNSADIEDAINDILDRVTNGAYKSLLNTLGGVNQNYNTALSQIATKLASFLNAFSPLNGSMINSGAIADRFIPGIVSIIDTLVRAFGGYSGSGYTYPTLQSIFNSGRLSIVDSASNITDLKSRTSILESLVYALQNIVNGLLHPFGLMAMSAGAGPMALAAGPSVTPMASAAPRSAFGGATGVTDSDDFERYSATSLGPQWVTLYSSGGGAGVWATPTGHDAKFIISGSENRDFLSIRANPEIARSETDYQRVTKVLSKSAGWLYDTVAGEWSYCGYNDVWLRISDDTTSFDDVTGIRVRFGGDGSISIDRFVSGIGTELKSLPPNSVIPPGPGATITGEAGFLRDQIVRYFRAMLGISTMLEITEVGVASKIGIAYRRWGHGGRATGYSDIEMPDQEELIFGQQAPGDCHYWNGVDQIV